MRTALTIFFIAVVCLASATFKDPRKNLHPVAPLSQEEVARQQALQKQQNQVGVVPEKTDESGYAPRFDSDPNAAEIVANHGPSQGGGDAEQVLKQNDEEMKSEAEKPKKTAFGALWALFAGLVMAFGVWAGLQKFGPKPPEETLRKT